MPELPEVEVVRAGLAPAVSGALVLGVTVLDERALTRHAGDGTHFEARLTGRVVLSAARRGKFLWLPLQPDTGDGAAADAVVGHLGMSGQMLLRAPGAPAERHERVRLDLGAPGARRAVRRVRRSADVRLAGDRRPDPDRGCRARRLGLGGGIRARRRSPTSRGIRSIPAFSDSAVRLILRRKDSAIKRVLLDQTVVSGVGNIYADEALWAARIHPETPAHALSTRAVNRLLAEVRRVLEKALAEGGTSFDAQYVNVNGQAGYFAHSLNAYGRTGEPCPRCGRPIVRVSFTNRSSHFCPHCQRVPRSVPGPRHGV